MPGFIESGSGDRSNERVVIGGGEKERRCICRHRCGCSKGWVDRSSKIRLALGIVLHHCTHDDSASSRKARDSDAVRIKAPLGGVATDKADRLATIFFSPSPGRLHQFVTHW